MAAEPAQDMRRRASQEKFYRDSATNTQITPRPRTRGPHPQRLPWTHFERGPQLNRFSIQVRAEIRACQRNESALWKQKCPAEQRHLQPGCALSIANQTISQAKRDRIRRPGS